MRSRIETVLLRTLLASIGSIPIACGGATTLDGPSTPGGTVLPDGGTTPANNCLDPTFVVGEGSGFVSCSNGFVHRSEVRTCPSLVPRATKFHLSDQDQCSFDTDCTSQPHGYCSDLVISTLATFCNYGCVTDAECAVGEICECGDPVGQCRVASCKSDADCLPGKLCTSYDASPACMERQFACQTPGDTCAGDPECGNDKYCTIVANRRQCTGLLCIIGRPYLVAGELRVAPVVPSSAWLIPSEREVPAELSADDRVAISRSWLRAAQLEHASVAAFARFQLQLLRLGAPPDLILLCASAMSDEVAHARICFGLARRYGDVALGPGELDIDGSLGSSSLAEVVRQTVEEGCVGETLAALEAGEAASYAADPLVRDALLRISDDESRHAALAFRFVSWIWERRPELRSIIELAFDRVTRASNAAAVKPLCEDEQRLLGHGVIPESLRESLRARGLREVVAPCRAALARRWPDRATSSPDA